jgi:inosine-uridine nucleoside N-ribohydrolase
MFSKLKKGLKRAIIFVLILGAIAVVVITVTNLAGDRLFGPRTTQILIDTDSGNEIDDLFAVTRALISPELDVIGITSAHWEFSEMAGDTSLVTSQRINEEILDLLEMKNIPHPAGAPGMLRFYGDPVPRNSPAAEFIIKKALEIPKNKKLNIVTLGALTNVASAIIMKPEIIPKIRIYMIGLKYDPRTKTWNKNEFNARNDLDAVDVLLNASGLEMHIMTATASKDLVFSREEARKYLLNKGGIWDYLIKKWEQRYPDNEDWIMWDVALIEAIIDPELAKVEETLTPPENKQRTVKVYTYINKELMIADFYASVLKYQRNQEEPGN